MPQHTTPVHAARHQAPYYERKVEMALDTAALNDLRGYVKKRVGYLQYRVGTTYTKVQISDVQILSSGVVRVQASIVPNGAVTINRVELYNNAGQLWAHQDVSVSLDQYQTGVLYWFDFTIKEASE